MSGGVLYAACGAALVGIGAWGALARAHLLRRLLALNILGSGVFLLFGGLAWRAPALGSDPVPQALVITGVVVALAATALAAAMIGRLVALSGDARLADEAGARDAPPDPRD